MAARRHGQEGAFALSLQMYKARFASFTTFQFAQKVSKSLRQDTFHGSKSPLRSWTPALEELSVLARADPLAVGVLSWTHALGQLSVLPHADPLAAGGVSIPAYWDPASLIRPTSKKTPIA